MNKKVGIVICFALILIILSTTYVAAFTISPYSSDVESYFNKICDVPYKWTPNNGVNSDLSGSYAVSPDQFWKNGYGDCDDRALAFKTFLLSKGATNVKICHVYKVNDNGVKQLLLTHWFVVWNNKVYSPSNPTDERFYNTDISTYKTYLKNRYGFNHWCDENQTEGTAF